MNDSVVKSAQRVLEVLEYFAQQREPMSVTDISRQLGYPQSSTSVLLKSLETTGYLRYLAARRQYEPTLRVMLLGAWMHDNIFGEGSLVAVMDKLRRQTGQTVMMGLRQGLHVRYILTLRGANVGSVGRSAGTVIPVCLSAMGKVLLAEEKDAEIGRIARRANALAEGTGGKVVIASLLDEVRQCRVEGWAQSLDFPRSGRAALAVPLPPILGQPAMALGLGATKARIETQRQSLVERLQEACSSLHARAVMPG